MITQGLNSSGGIISQGLNGHFILVPVVDYWVSVGGAPGYFVRIDRTHQLAGPYSSFRRAATQATFLSKHSDARTAEIVYFTGKNSADKYKIKCSPAVVQFFHRGYSIAVGKAASQLSKDTIITKPGPLG